MESNDITRAQVLDMLQNIQQRAENLKGTIREDPGAMSMADETRFYPPQEVLDLASSLRLDINEFIISSIQLEIMNLRSSLDIALRDLHPYLNLERDFGMDDGFIDRISNEATKRFRSRTTPRA